MAVTYSFDGTLLSMELAGTYVSADVVRQFLAALNDPRCPQRIDLLADVSRSESLATRPTEEIRAVAEFLGPYHDRIGGRCAVVAEPDVNFGLSQMGSVFSDGVGVITGVFRTREEAMGWLKAPSAGRV